MQQARELVFLAGAMAERLERYGDLLAPLTEPDRGRPIPDTP